MPCLPLPLPSLPSLPAGISVTTPGLGGDFDVRLCCKLAQFDYKIPPIPFGVGVPPVLMTALAIAQEAILQYIDLLPVRCPRE
jgi:hypothetical protein